MVETPGPSIPPVLVLGTGRCGSTMVSNLLNAHPRILSLSEFFSYVGMDAFRLRNPTGDQLWQTYSRQRPRTRLMLRESYEELLYPVDGPAQRFTRTMCRPFCAPHFHISLINTKPCTMNWNPSCGRSLNSPPCSISGICSPICASGLAVRSGLNARA